MKQTKRSKEWLEVYDKVYRELSQTMSSMDWDVREYVEKLMNDAIKMTDKIINSAHERSDGTA